MEARDRLSRRGFMAHGAVAGGALLPSSLIGCEWMRASAAGAARGDVTRFGFTTYQGGKDWDVQALIAQRKIWDGMLARSPRAKNRSGEEMGGR